MLRAARLLLVAPVLLLNACASGFVASGVNATNVATVDFSKVNRMKRGEACATTVLGLFTTGEAITTEAAKAGDISKVALLEHKFSGSPPFTKQCVIAFGE